MEGIEQGFAELVGTEVDKIVLKANQYLDHPKFINKEQNPYGTGNAAQQILAYLLHNK
jgi:UDP-N-acetylglucosamine 2-epimerase